VVDERCHVLDGRHVMLPNGSHRPQRLLFTSLKGQLMEHSIIEILYLGSRVLEFRVFGFSVFGFMVFRFRFLGFRG
jgi:hypothetical protein